MPTDSPVRHLYILTLTGAPDGTTDVDIPIRSINGRVWIPDYLSYMTVVCEFSYLAEISDRIDGELIISRVIESATGGSSSTDMIRANLEQIREDEGVNSKSITLTGRGQHPVTTPKAHTLVGVMSRYQADSSRWTAYYNDNTALSPGDNVTVDFSGENFTAKEIRFRIGNNNEVIEVTKL